MTCKCIDCPACQGDGTVWIAFDGTYLGNSRCDDLDELDSCNECGGSGVSENCDDCYDYWKEQEGME